ncbi:hypothetical protein TRVL_04322 [Trypanosoma vivax]|nr:hypothetical protein TRVL_04322 [Trypanosoma vivax]
MCAYAFLLCVLPVGPTLESCLCDEGHLTIAEAAGTRLLLRPGSSECIECVPKQMRVVKTRSRRVASPKSCAGGLTRFATNDSVSTLALLYRARRVAGRADNE